MKNPFKVKDRVYHFVHGWGEVLEVDQDSRYNTYVKFSDELEWYRHKELSFDEYEAPKVNHRRKVTIEVTEGDLILIGDLYGFVCGGLGGVIRTDVVKKYEELTNRIKKSLEDE